MSDLLSPEFLGRLERLQLATQRPLAGRFAADHRSPRHGTSMDFADFRQYHPGDDYRRIDYLTLARLDILLIKLFEAEDDLQVRVLVDTSAPPFCVTYEGCHVMNPGSLLVPGRTKVARWVEYEVGKVGRMKEVTF